MSIDSSLSVGELLARTLEVLKERFSGRKVELPSRVTSEIANDSDWHRTRVGYMAYEAATLVTVGDNVWALALGTTCGSYPADPYNSDIVAVSISPDGKSEGEVAQMVHEALGSSSYFSTSLVIGVADGRLAVNSEGRFGEKVEELLKSITDDFIAQDVETDPTVYHMDSRPVVKSAMRYTPECVERLSDSIEQVIAA